MKIVDRAFANCVSLSSITISETVSRIGKQAFYNCKNLRTVIIKTGVLSNKTIGEKAFAGTYKKLTVKVPAKQLEYYGAAEPPVRCGESHLSGLTEPPHFVY